MSGVDVLAVMDELALMNAANAALDPKYQGLSTNDADEARSAVAELIDAVHVVYGEPCLGVECSADCMSCRITIAVARCRGEA